MGEINNFLHTIPLQLFVFVYVYTPDVIIWTDEITIGTHDSLSPITSLTVWAINC